MSGNILFKNNIIFTGIWSFGVSEITEKDECEIIGTKGKISFKDEQGTYEAVKAITNKYENAESPASFDKLPQEYVDQMVKAIVGFTIEVESFDNTFKLSQNRDKDSQKNIITQLRKVLDRNSLAIADEMEKRL